MSPGRPSRVDRTHAWNLQIRSVVHDRSDSLTVTNMDLTDCDIREADVGRGSVADLREKDSFHARNGGVPFFEPTDIDD
jgi:hypothetical protein